MEVVARYNDGLVAIARDVICRLDGAGTTARLIISDLVTRAELDTWPAADVFPVHARKDELRIGASGKPYGARIALQKREDIQLARQMLPALIERHRQDRGKQLQLVGISTGALVSVIVAYIFGVPLLAGNIVRVMPTQWEQDFGDTVATQLEAQLKEEGGWEICDPNPNSVANRAIARFADAAMEGAGSPFKPSITVVRSSVPNAFALPGGKAFYFSALLDQTETPDEFAGVMAHELGHVAHRHVMESLVSSAGTGLLIGFILGDMSGLSIAGGLGALLIDTRFSRQAEAEADRFSAAVAARLGFDPVGLPNLLERVSADDDFTRALALLSTHPLTEERRRALEAIAEPRDGTIAAFSDEEWQAIKGMCGRSAAPPVTPIAGPTKQLPSKDKVNLPKPGTTGG
jgi:Zn-dependent protease with chaperone function